MKRQCLLAALVRSASSFVTSRSVSTRSNSSYQMTHKTIQEHVKEFINSKLNPGTEIIDIHSLINGLGINPSDVVKLAESIEKEYAQVEEMLSKDELKAAFSRQLQEGDKGIVFLDKSDEKEALNVFADAFQEDPLMAWIAGLDDSDPQSKDAVVELGTYVMAHAANRVIRGERGCALGIQDEESRLAGIIALKSAHCDSNVSQVFDDLVSTARLGMIPIPEGKGDPSLPAKRFNAFIEKISTSRKEHMSDTNKWVYLQAIAVRTTHQGGPGKYGAKMLRLMNSVADTEGLPIYLETESLNNESMYAHFGFRTVEEANVSVPGDERSDAVFKLYLMRRDPA